MVRRRDYSDRALGIRTSRTVSAQTLGLAGARARDARDYQPTPPDIFEDMLLDADVAFERFTFVDLGAGKGRVLCLASAHPFERILGVELSEALWRTAQDNLRSFSAPWQRCRHLGCVLDDAAAFEFPDGPLMVFMYNPFGAPVVKRVIANLGRSFEAHPREIWILYFEPVHRDVLDRVWWLEPAAASRRWAVYRTRPA